MAMEIVPVPVLTDNYVWLIHNEDSGETAAVDPSVSDPVLDSAKARGWSLTQIVNTHWHPDHTGGNQGIKAATGCTITAPADGAIANLGHYLQLHRGARPSSGTFRRIRLGTLLIISRTRG